MIKLVLIFAGSGAGGLLRYAVTAGAQSLTAWTFPIGTLIVNVLGCLTIGFLGAAFTGPLPIREEYRIAILVGLLGGFTTFSAFGQETFALAANRAYWLVAANILLSNALGLAAVWIGTRLVARWFGS